jgi:hypothetical protein
MPSTSRSARAMSPTSRRREQSYILYIAIGALVVSATVLGVVMVMGIREREAAEASSGARPHVLRMPHGETRAFNGDEPLEECDGHITFPAEARAACEGYWRDSEQPQAGNSDKATLPWPVARPVPFCGESAWAKRLRFLEARAREDEKMDEAALGRPKGSIELLRIRGLATSRLDGTLLGNQEFVDRAPPGRHEPVCWTGDFRDHYVEQHHVVPSRRFYEYVIAKYNTLDKK